MENGKNSLLNNVGEAFEDSIEKCKNEQLKRGLSAELGNVFSLEEVKAEVKWGKVLQNFFRGKSGISSTSQYLKPISGLCLAQPKEQKFLIKFRRAGLQRMNLLLRNTMRKEVQAQDVKLLTWCCLNLLSFYYSKGQNQHDDCNCFGKHKFEQSKVLFRSAMYLVLPEKQVDVIRYSIKYMTLTGQWNTEDYDSFVFQELLTMITKPEFLVAKIIKQTECSQREGDIKQTYNISCTLSTILENVYWDKYLFNHLLHNCLNTLLKIYLLCDEPVAPDHSIRNAKLRLVLKNCIRCFISNIKDNKGLVSVMDSMAKCLHDPTLSDDNRVEITEMIAFCAQRHVTKYFRESITPDLLDLLLFDFYSSEKSVTMLSHKIFHHLLDRHGNIKYFTEPVYFFKGRSDLTINYDYGIEDIHFFNIALAPFSLLKASILIMHFTSRSFSKKFLEGIHQCLLRFSDKYELVLFYSTLCLVLVEVPEPVITINVIHVIITIQNDVLKEDANFSAVTKAQIHACIASIMSLICIIHRDDVNTLEKYVEEVVQFRVENSPHLLPPLLTKYNIASHHTTEYHDQLYFLEEEVIFALQRCWLTKRLTTTR